MAAPDAKTSPSHKEVQQTASSTEVADCGATKTSPTKAAMMPTKEESSLAPTVAAAIAAPTYESSEKSEKYVLAKSLLASGDFEQAMELIEEAIQEAQAVLISLQTPESEMDLHECMGPFHYLYGTTLLYSIEESNDTQMTVAQTEEGVDPQTEEDDAAAAAAVPQESSETPLPPAEANVEDMEIAWENLDTARNIVQAMLTNDNNKATRAPEETTKLQLDLAQILLREGDLQRLNGRYSEAIMDYEACLNIRKDLLPPFDRKIADAQYNLGLSYLSNSTELQKDENPDASKLKVSQEHCQKGVQLYVDCARTLCGQIANLCGMDHGAILSHDDNDENASSSKKAGMKTTGMDEAELAASDASQALNTWRAKVASLTPVEEDDPRVADLRELLEEIQETVDEAERSQQAVREASQLKVMAQKAITQADDGSTTQIGFGQPTIAATVPEVPPTQPMMVVKKKKKRDADGEEASDAKRAKTDG